MSGKIESLLFLNKNKSIFERFLTKSARNSWKSSTEIYFNCLKMQQDRLSEDKSNFNQKNNKIIKNDH